MQHVRVSVVGASGFGGAEAVRLLLAHPRVRLAHLTADSQAGQPIGRLYPNLAGLVDRPLVPAEPARIGRDSDVAIVSLPSGKSMNIVPALLAEGCRVIDVGADFRLRDPSLYPEWYRFDHAAPALANESVYGLPALHRDALRQARLVANPGCFPVASLLALLPLLRAGYVPALGTVIDAKTGVTGAGRGGGGGFGFAETNEDVRAYSVAAHGHTAEIEQEASLAAGRPTRVAFTPHLVPMSRGILATVYVPLARPLGQDEALALYANAYAGEPFTRVLREALPRTKATLGSNYCDLTVRVDARTSTAIAIAAIDNLVRGAAGQAIQNLNLMFGLAEDEGLRSPGLFP